MDSNCKSAILVILDIYWVISLTEVFGRMPWKFHLLLQKQHTVMWTVRFFLRRNEEKQGDSQRARTLTCLHRQAKKKGREEERERDPPSVSSPSLLSHWRSCRWAEIGVAWPQLYWGQLSARLCWNYGLAFCPRRTDLAVTLNTASPRGWQILSPHFPNFAQKTNATHQPTANPAPQVASP